MLPVKIHSSFGFRALSQSKRDFVFLQILAIWGNLESVGQLNFSLFEKPSFILWERNFGDRNGIRKNLPERISLASKFSGSLDVILENCFSDIREMKNLPNFPKLVSDFSGSPKRTMQASLGSFWTLNFSFPSTLTSFNSCFSDSIRSSFARIELSSHFGASNRA